MKSIKLTGSLGAKTKALDKEAFFKTLFDEYFTKLFYFAKKFVKSEEVAQDIVSEVFYITWKNVANIEEIKDIRSYLYTCTKNESIRFLKSEVNKNISIAENDNWESVQFAIENFTPEKAILQNELQDLIEQTIDSLPTQCKMAFKFVKEDRLKHDEVAKLMHVSPNTVKNHVVKALKRIRENLEVYYIDNQQLNKKKAKVVSMNTLKMFMLSGIF